ncbi:hypothetical protein ACFQT0_12750 [Hymenobacter humi]|uniref:Uncharacterized protein n=1 Tax=Hymenobacter humi TaxID=1411620 RepID=A0ABW2U7U6_9BACT
MKSAANYLEAHVFEARRPRRELQPVVAYSDAVHAIEQAWPTLRNTSTC